MESGKQITHVLLIINPTTKEVLRAAGYDFYPDDETRKALAESWGARCEIIDGDAEYVDTMQWIYRAEIDTGRTRL